MKLIRKLMTKQYLNSFANGLLIAAVVGATAGLVLEVLQHVVAAVCVYSLVIGLLAVLEVVERRYEQL